MRKHFISGAAAIVALTLLSGHGAAMNSDDPRGPAEVRAELAKAETSITGKDYRAAIVTLIEVVRTNPRNADAYNLLGYSYRKSKDFKRAERNYSRALRLDPDHKGALEYMGELFLETDRRDKAQELLARLEKLCPNGCEELDDLRAAFDGKQTSAAASGW